MATKTDAISQVYARSLYELADKAGGADKIAEVAEELEQISQIMREDTTFALYLASPVIDTSRRQEAIRRIFRDRVTDLTLRFLLVLNDKGRLGHLASVTEAFDQLVQEAFGRIEVDLYTAAPVEPDQLDRLRERISEALGQEPVLYPYTDPSMIGGVMLRIGDQLIDGSVSGRLRRLQQELTSGSTRMTDGAGMFE
jgi:F-type H+-transporting ATPase subunit delta